MRSSASMRRQPPPAWSSFRTRTPEGIDLAVALGGDGTMLRALHRFLGAGVPVIGVNFGRIGFLTSIAADDLENGLARAFAGDYKVVELATIAASVGGRPHGAVNDVVATSSTPGRMVELGASLAGESLGVTACDGMICSTPSGSTAYNLSSGGPVIMRGLDAMAVTYVAPHSLHIRTLVVPPGLGMEVTNRTPDVAVTVLVDGQAVTELEPGQALSVDVGTDKALLASPPRGHVLQPLPRRVPRATLTPVLRRLRIENLVLIQRGGARARARTQRRHGRDRGGQDHPRARHRIAARRAGRRVLRRARPAPRRTSRPSSISPTACSRTEAFDAVAELAPADEPGLVGGAPDLRRRSQPRVRVGAGARAGGRRRARRAPRRHVGPVRAAPAGAPGTPARPARRLRGRRPASPTWRRGDSLAQAPGRTPPPRGARARRGRPRGPCDRAAGAPGRLRGPRSRRRGDAARRARARCATRPRSQRQRWRRPRRWLLSSATPTELPTSRRGPSARSGPSRRSRPSSR